MENKVTMSIRGFEDKLERYREISTVVRKEIITRIQEARSHGDLSENAEYTAARDAQAMNEGEIAQLEYEIKNADIIMTDSEKKEALESIAKREQVLTVELEKAKAELEHRLEIAIREGIVSEREMLDWEIAKVDMRIGNNYYIIETMKDTVAKTVAVKDFKTVVVRLGSKVTVLDLELEEEDTYEIVGPSETDALKNKICEESPVGEALMGKKKGDVVKIKAPDGEYEMEILNVE